MTDVQPPSAISTRLHAPSGTAPLPPLLLDPGASLELPLAGAVIADQYQLLRLLHRGGLGAVFYAEHLHMGRKVALKLLEPSQAQSPARVAQFLQEARAAARIQHPNVVKVFDFGEAEGTVFSAMELLRGRSLLGLLRGAEPLALALVVAVARQLCLGVRAAHRAGVVHRDIRPGYVFWTVEGRVKLAHFLHATIEGRSPSGPRGPSRFRAPELASGSADERVDVFAVGSILRELLGRCEEPRARALEEVALQATDEDPDQRVTSAEGLLAAIEGALLALGAG